MYPSYSMFLYINIVYTWILDCLQNRVAPEMDLAEKSVYINDRKDIKASASILIPGHVNGPRVVIVSCIKHAQICFLHKQIRHISAQNSRQCQ